MALYGNPDELDRLAGQIEERAEELRERAGEMDTQAGAMRWKSIAADRCRDTVRGDRKNLDDIAYRLDEAGAMLRKHAAQLRETVAVIKNVEGAVTDWFEGTINEFNQAVKNVESAVGATVDSVGRALGLDGNAPAHQPTPPWLRWPYQPGNLPPAGDKAWLDVGDFLRKQGVL